MSIPLWKDRVESIRACATRTTTRSATSTYKVSSVKSVAGFACAAVISMPTRAERDRAIHASREPRLLPVWTRANWIVNVAGAPTSITQS